MGCKKSFFTHFAPTVQIQRLTQDNITTNSVISNLQKRIHDAEEDNRALNQRLEHLENAIASDNNNTP